MVSIFCAHRFVLVTAFILTVTAAHAGDDDHEIARHLLQEGRIRPLVEIVEAVRAKIPGEILEVEFEAEDGSYIYTVKILSPGGRVQEVEVDAASGEIGEIEDDDD